MTFYFGTTSPTSWIKAEKGSRRFWPIEVKGKKVRNHTMNVRHSDGDLLEIEYETEGDGSGPSYSPMFGADSGDPLIVYVLNAWSDEYGDCVLSDEESELIAAFITENHEFEPSYFEED